MNIIIVGAGEVGQHLCTIMGSNHDVTLIEREAELASRLDDEHDVRVVQGNGSHASVLVKAGVAKCDFFLAMTSDDKTNLLSSSLAKALGHKTTTITRIHDQTYNESSIINYQSHFGIDHLLNPEALSAVELAKAIRNPGRIAVENFARGQIEVQQIRVREKAKVLGKTLAELRLDPRIRVGYVQSGDTQEVAHAGTVLQPGDLVTVFGLPQVLFELRSIFNPDTEAESSRVVLYGGGETAIALIRMLANTRFRVRVLEKNPKVCQKLAESFPGITVINGDATSLRLMEEEQIGDADYFVACTKDDEANVMTCLQASKLGAKHVLLLVNRADYLDVLERLKETLGLELVVSPRLATANEVVRYISRDPYIDLARLGTGDSHIIEVKVFPKSPADGKMLKEIKWPAKSVVVGLLHQTEATVPGANDLINGGDRLVAIVKKDLIPELLTILHG